MNETTPAEIERAKPCFSSSAARPRRSSPKWRPSQCCHTSAHHAAPSRRHGPQTGAFQSGEEGST